MSDSVRPHRRQPTRLHCPWDSPGKNTGVSCHFLLQCMKVKSESEVGRSYPTLSDPMDCSLPGSSIHGIFQARVLDWGTIAFSKGTSELFNSYKSFTISTDYISEIFSSTIYLSIDINPSICQYTATFMCYFQTYFLYVIIKWAFNHHLKIK